jgi:hypothetical protein
MGLVVDSYRFAAAGFQPTDIAGCTLWLDASDTATITDSGGAVSQWDDLSGSGFDVKQSTGGNKPTTGTTTQNGLNTISVDGDDFMLSDSDFPLTGAAAHTAIYVAKTTSSSSWAWVFSWGNGTTRTQRAHGRTFGSTELRLAVIGDDYTTGTNLGTTAYNVASIRYDGSTTANAWLNGSATSTASKTFGAALNTGATKFNLARSAPYSQPWTGQVAEIIIYDTALGTTDREAVEDYLADKWGL